MKIIICFIACLSLVSGYVYAGKAVNNGASRVKKPPLWQLTNSVDGSQHLLLGTLHRVGLRLGNFPDSILKAIETSDTLIRETDTEAGCNEVCIYSDPLLSYHRESSGNANLPEKLGEKRWNGLMTMLEKAKEGLSPEQIDQLRFDIHNIEKQDATFFLGLIHASAMQAVHGEHSSIDAEIVAHAHGSDKGKKVVGLETQDELAKHSKQLYKASVEHLRNIDSDGRLQLEQLQNFIDREAGLLEDLRYGLRDVLRQLRYAYLDGEAFTAVNTLNLIPDFRMIPYIR